MISNLSLGSKSCNRDNHIYQYNCGSNNEIDRIPSNIIDNDLDGIFLNTFDKFNVSVPKTTLKHRVGKAKKKALSDL